MCRCFVGPYERRYICFMFDYFYRCPFHPIAHESYTSLTSTAVVVAAVSKTIAFLWRFPSLPTVQASTTQVYKLLTDTESVFSAPLSDVTQDEIPPQYIPCPLHVRRTALHNTRLHPFMLSKVH